MTRIITTPKCLLVEVPEDSSDLKIHYLGEIPKLVFSSKIQDPLKCGGDMIHLPPASYGEPVLASEANEAQAEGRLPHGSNP